MNAYSREYYPLFDVSACLRWVMFNKATLEKKKMSCKMSKVRSNTMWCLIYGHLVDLTSTSESLPHLVNFYNHSKNVRNMTIIVIVNFFDKPKKLISKAHP